MLFGNVRSVFDIDKFHFSEIDFELDSFNEYLELTNTTVKNKLYKYLNEFHQDGGYDNQMWDGSEAYVKSKILQIYYSSIIISIYTFLEHSMYRLCKLAAEKKTIKVNDIAGNGIFKYKTYLQKVAEIDFQPMNSEWQEIIKFNHLRNQFVHNSNNFIDRTTSPSSINSMRSISGIKLKEVQDGYIIKFEDDSSIRTLLILIRNFCIKIYYSDYYNFPEISRRMAKPHNCILPF